MSDHTALIDLVRAHFTDQVDAIEPPAGLAGTVRRRLRRRRTGGVIATGAGLVAAALALGMSAGSPPATKTIRLSSYTIRVPASAHTSSACLNDPEAWARQWSPAGGTFIIGELAAVRHGVIERGCSVVAVTVTARPPTATSTLGSGANAVYVTSAARIAYLAFTPEQSARLAARNGWADRPYYLIGEISAGNDSSVLSAALHEVEPVIADR